MLWVLVAGIAWGVGKTGNVSVYLDTLSQQITRIAMTVSLCRSGGLVGREEGNRLELIELRT